MLNGCMMVPLLKTLCQRSARCWAISLAHTTAPLVSSCCTGTGMARSSRRNGDQLPPPHTSHRLSSNHARQPEVESREVSMSVLRVGTLFVCGLALLLVPISPDAGGADDTKKKDKQ